MIGIGVDAVDVSRFRVAIDNNPALIERLLTEQERVYAFGLADPAPSLAVRFAAKEAAMKAMGVGLGAFRFHDVEVVRHESGVPSLELTGTARSLADQLGIVRWLVSLTHTADTATAMVVAE